MYVKLMQQVSSSLGNEFVMLQIHKGQSIGFYSPPGKGMQLEVVENDAVVERHPVNGPVYVLSETGKTIAQYAMSYGSAIQTACAGQQVGGQLGGQFAGGK